MRCLKTSLETDLLESSCNWAQCFKQLQLDEDIEQCLRLKPLTALSTIFRAIGLKSPGAFTISILFRTGSNESSHR